MSLPDSDGVVRRPMVSSSWKNVQQATSNALTKCNRWFKDEGAIQYVDGESAPVVAPLLRYVLTELAMDGTNAMMIYVFDSRSATFILKLNEYMSGSTAINPWHLYPSTGSNNITNSTV